MGRMPFGDARTHVCLLLRVAIHHRKERFLTLGPPRPSPSPPALTPGSLVCLFLSALFQSPISGQPNWKVMTRSVFLACSSTTQAPTQARTCPRSSTRQSTLDNWLLHLHRLLGMDLQDRGYTLTADRECRQTARRRKGLDDYRGFLTSKSSENRIDLVLKFHKESRPGD